MLLLLQKIHIFSTYSNYRKHHLCYVESMPPVVVDDIAIVFLNTEKPTTQHFIIDMKPFDKI